MSFNSQNSVSVPEIQITNCMGSLLTPQSLCYIIRAITNKDSSAAGSGGSTAEEAGSGQEG
jgi:hypothetical protein